jgi:WD domain, G-beta repeat
MSETVAGTAHPADDRLTALIGFDSALRRESHVLRERPDLTWQQLYNRLQWEGPPIAGRLTAERERGNGPGAHPWIHRYTRLHESEAFVRTLTGHTGSVSGCAVSPDGTWLVSASADRTLKIWDVATGTEPATLAGHTGVVNGCAVSPDGSWIVSASWDRTVKIWDAATGAERAVLILPGGATAVASHPSAPIVVCGDGGGGVHLARLVGIDLGPLVVTAAIDGRDLTARCPACRQSFPVESVQLGTETTCPNPACGRQLRLNPFTLH